MYIRLGYVAISKTIENLTTSHTISYTNYLKEHNQKSKINDIILCNLSSLEQIIDYNICNNIHFYRITSNLIPLATHQEVQFDYIDAYQKQYQKIGNKIKRAGMRVDFHPDQYAVLNSTKKEVIENTIEILQYHYKLLKALDVQFPHLVLHVGSSVFGKEKAMKRFIYQFKKLPFYLQKVIILENDDKTYTVKDTLFLCETLDIPMVLDVHHYLCNHEDDSLEDYWDRIWATWKGETPKIHFSSPKNHTKKEIRSHHDYIMIDDFLSFLAILKKHPTDLDIMIEAKAKDDALFRLMRQLKYKCDFKFVDDTSFIIDN